MGVPVILPLDLVIPTRPDAVEIELSRVELAGATVSAPGVFASFDHGVLSGLVHPVLARDDGLLGAYRVATPVAWFERLAARDVPLAIVRDGRTIQIALDSAELEAFNGSFDGRSNFVRGTVVLGGVTVEIEPTALDPDFDQATFDASYACTESLGSPVPSE